MIVVRSSWYDRCLPASLRTGPTDRRALASPTAGTAETPKVETIDCVSSVTLCRWHCVRWLPEQRELAHGMQLQITDGMTCVRAAGRKDCRFGGLRRQTARSTFGRGWEALIESYSVGTMFFPFVHMQLHGTMVEESHAPEDPLSLRIPILKSLAGGFLRLAQLSIPPSSLAQRRLLLVVRLNERNVLRINGTQHRLEWLKLGDFNCQLLQTKPRLGKEGG